MGTDMRFIGGLLDGQSFDRNQINAIANEILVTTEAGVREFVLMPSAADCGRILLGELSKEQAQMPLSSYERFHLPGGAAEYRVVSGGVFAEAFRSRDAKLANTLIQNARKEAVNVFLIVTAIFAVFCWVPMFLANTPSWALWTQALLVLMLGYFVSNLGLLNQSAILGGTTSESDALNFRMMCPSTIAGCLTIFSLITFAPDWSGWEWLFPGLAALPCLVLAFIAYLGVAPGNW